jgi:triacylglycerol esterase/lipase EstA (alpha/beta hydrolase family)
MATKERRRPIIFLCHSYGGLVVKEALIRAAESSDDYPDLMNNTHGVIFLGTPHFGTKYSDYARRAALRLDRLASNPDLFLPLRVNSSSLQSQHTTFMANFPDLELANMYETRKTALFPLTVSRIDYRVMVCIF